ncbi:hypothetical protein [Microbacterium sp. C7(2022)]|uniref:hypothetical protein n=1 Tax=Microbacterium sp. C7(2022) TaxID=2992759 RepID=UPI00237BAE22|nr:hypothetical protein [Microbacterium sp. C7(2022)]MDE0546340.1 hypothetical protein [Microbacterium sp. C7(2022)]
MSLHRSHTCRKVRFRDHREAVSALHNVTTLRLLAEEAQQPSRRREVRCYECDACRGYHLTSVAA